MLVTKNGCITLCDRPLPASDVVPVALTTLPPGEPTTFASVPTFVF